MNSQEDKDMDGEAQESQVGSLNDEWGVCLDMVGFRYYFQISPWESESFGFQFSEPEGQTPSGFSWWIGHKPSSTSAVVNLH